ncbi:MAG: C25 family cysteine peptidase [Candidatus Thermoplasmatota archaeon]|nr:C25 family cysteine peptidase [Candidatus Thermoplasmatota archaeon]
MKKLFVFVIIGFLLIGGLGVAGYDAGFDQNIKQDITLKTPMLQINPSEKQEYLSLQLTDVNTYQTNPGEPRVPKIVHTFELPFGATDIVVSLTPLSISTTVIEKQVQPASVLLPLTPEYVSYAVQSEIKDKDIYAMNTPYPEEWYTTTVSCGLNSEYERVTFVNIQYYPIRYIPGSSSLLVAESADISVTYKEPEGVYFPQTASFDLVIIAPESFSQPLQPLVDHKNDMGVSTFLKTTEDIYSEYSGVDKPAQIKNFIKDAIETQGITYVLLVGGLNNVYFAKPRDDSNQGSSAWYVPVRYTNLRDNPKFPLKAESTIFDPGCISDLYYADIYREGGDFSEWDVNGDGIFAAWGLPGVENDTGIDMYPDVALGRLACRSIDEVNTLVNKIITYETSTYGKEWFKKMIVVSGDGFLDQQDLNILWDTNEVPNGRYTIYAQSSNPSGEHGPIISINVTKDSSQASVITYSHDDHLNPAIQEAFRNGFPTVPIAEIVTISEGDILGNTDVAFEPTSQAYCNEFFFWANVSYIDGVLTIRGKSYDPKPYGNLSSIHVWIEDSEGGVVFEDFRNDTEMYYEGEWTTGEKALLGRGGALYYMPDDFEKVILWTSNGKLRGMDDVITEMNKGAGFLFFSGHGSPNVWADQYPGIPGDRGPSSVTGLMVTTLRPWPPFITMPAFPMDTISNAEKLPIAVVGGCHNSQFNVSMIYGLFDIMHYFFPRFPELYMWCHGFPVPETFSWRLVRNPQGGAIASMGNTGLGYGMPGKELTTGGGDSWITIEFFRQYSEMGHDILGHAYQQTLTGYLNTFDMTDLEAGHPKTVQQWVLLGDPTLKIGGYQ